MLERAVEIVARSKHVADPVETDRHVARALGVARVRRRQTPADFQALGIVLERAVEIVARSKHVADPGEVGSYPDFIVGATIDRQSGAKIGERGIEGAVDHFDVATLDESPSVFGVEQENLREAALRAFVIIGQTLNRRFLL